MTDEEEEVIIAEERAQRIKKRQEQEELEKEIMPILNEAQEAITQILVQHGVSIFVGYDGEMFIEHNETGVEETFLG